MQKLPEASDMKRGQCMRKEKGPFRQKEESPLSAVTGGVTTSKSPLLLVEGHVTAL